MRLLKLFLLFSVILCCKGEEGEIGPSGLNSLIAMAAESGGSNCQNGGIRVMSGLDKNANDVLDTDEITSTSFVCNGVDGMTTLNTVVAEAVGNNCSAGGVKINSGWTPMEMARWMPPRSSLQPIHATV